jgi:hypothetical protein
MESFENKNIQKDLTDKEVHDLITSSYSRALKIYRKIAGNRNVPTVSVSATTAEAADKDMFGRLIVRHHHLEMDIELNEISEDNSDEDTTERFNIAFSRDTKRYELTVTGKQPNILNNLIENDASEKAMLSALQVSEQQVQQTFRTPTPAEVQRLYDVLDLGLYGDDVFHFDRFEAQYEELLDDLEMMRQEADELAAQNTKYPE